MDGILNKIEKFNLVDEAYMQLKQLILAGTWKEGEKIPSEKQLCQMLNVSRIVVREALQRLRSERMIVTYQGMGSFIANPRNFVNLDAAVPQTELTQEAFRQIMELRSCIEYHAIERSAVTASEADLEKIRQTADQMERTQDDYEKFTLADYAFHMAILESAHNPMLVRAMESCREPVLQCLGEMNRLNDSRRWGIDLHRQIAGCLSRREPQQAIRLLKKNDEYNSARMAQFFHKKETAPETDDCNK